MYVGKFMHMRSLKSLDFQVRKVTVTLRTSTVHDPSPDPPPPSQTTLPLRKISKPFQPCYQRHMRGLLDEKKLTLKNLVAVPLKYSKLKTRLLERFNIQSTLLNCFK